MSKFAGVSNKTNTASATVPMFNLVGAATRRLKVFELFIASTVLGDFQNKFALRRTTVDGSPLTDFTPTKLDPSEGTAASIARMDLTWTGAAEPTITANSEHLTPTFNQRIWYHWQAKPDSEIVIPAVAEAGLALLSLIAPTPADHVFNIFWEE